MSTIVSCSYGGEDYDSLVIVLMRYIPWVTIHEQDSSLSAMHHSMLIPSSLQSWCTVELHCSERWMIV